MSQASKTTRVCPNCKTAGPLGEQCLSCGYIYPEDAGAKPSWRRIARKAGTGAAFVLLLLVGAAAVWFAIGGFPLGQAQQVSSTPPAESSSTAPPQQTATAPGIRLHVGQSVYPVASGESVRIPVPGDTHAVDVFAKAKGKGAMLWTANSTRQYVPQNGIAEIACTGTRMERTNNNGVLVMRTVSCPATFTVRLEIAQP